MYSHKLFCAAPWACSLILTSISLLQVSERGQGTTPLTSFSLTYNWFMTLESPGVYSELDLAFLRISILLLLLFSQLAQFLACFQPRALRTVMLTTNLEDLHGMQTRLLCPQALCIVLLRECSRKLACQDRISATHLHPHFHPCWLIQWDGGIASFWLVSQDAICKCHI